MASMRRVSVLQAQFVHQRAAQLELLDFRCRHRPFVDESDMPRNLEGSEALPGIGDEFLRLDLHIAFAFDVGRGDFRQPLVRQPDDLRETKGCG